MLSDYLIHHLFNNPYTRQHLNFYLLLFAATILRSITDLFLYYFIATGSPIFDFGLSVVITLILSYLSPYFSLLLQPLDPYFNPLTTYLLDNYKYLNIWRQRLLLALSILLIILFHFVEINSQYLILTLTHFIIVYSILNFVNSCNDPLSPLHIIKLSAYRLIQFLISAFSRKPKVTIHQPMTSSMILTPIQEPTPTPIPKKNAPQNISPTTKNWLNYLKTFNQLFSHTVAL